MSELENQERQYRLILQQSVEARMRAMQEKIALAFTFCSTVEIEVRYGDTDRAMGLLHKLRSTVEGLTDHINNPGHVSGKQSKEFQEELVQLRNRLVMLESQNEQRRSHGPGGRIPRATSIHLSREGKSL